MNREHFKTWWSLQLMTYDCDPSIYVMRYLIERFELNVEQQHWLCWLYANTYQLPTAWVLFNEFPDFENVCLEGLTAWNAVHSSRLPYQKDQKWLRGRLGETFKSYRAVVENAGSQSLVWHGKDFMDAWQLISKSFHRFGRYTAWFYLQALDEICFHSFTPTHMFLKDDSSKQPREGLMRATGLTDLKELDAAALEILDSMPEPFKDRKRTPIRANLFSMETALCSYSKLGRGAPKGRYLGYYLDRFAEDIEKTAAHDWWGINWDALWEARDEMLLPSMNFKKVRPEEMDAYPMLGEFMTDGEQTQFLQELLEYV